MGPLDPSAIVYALCISGLICATRMSWCNWKAHKAEGGHTPELALSCICVGLVLFMTVVPAVVYVLLVPDLHPAPLNIDPMGVFP